jgi:hypothetical membrane protein
MKNLLSLLLGIFLILSLFVVPVLAQTNNASSPLGEYPYGEFEKLTEGVSIKPKNLLETALNWVFNIVLVISIIMLIYSGYLYATAGGDQVKTKKAMSTLIYALIGIAIVVASKALVNIMGQFLGKPEGIFPTKTTS